MTIKMIVDECDKYELPDITSCNNVAPVTNLNRFIKDWDHQ
jgi:hypothetical protein